MSAAMLGAQSQSPDSGIKSSNGGKNAAAPSAATTTFTGCLTPGSASDSYYLMNSKQKGVKGDAKTVKLVPATKKVDLGTFVTQGVEVTGTMDQANSTAPPAGGSESAPTFTVTKIKSSSSGC